MPLPELTISCGRERLNSAARATSALSPMYEPTLCKILQRVLVACQAAYHTVGALGGGAIACAVAGAWALSTLSGAQLHAGLVHALGPLVHAGDPAHDAMRLLTALAAGLALGLSGAAWQTLRRAPGACVHLAGLPLAASLGGIVGHVALNTGRWPLTLAPWTRGLPVVTSVAGALCMALVLTALAQRRLTHAGRVLGLGPQNSTDRDSVICILLTGALSALLLHYYVPTEPLGAIFWFLGSFHHGHEAPWIPAAICMGLGVAALTYVNRAMGQLLAGDRWAQHNGVAIGTTRVLAYVGICLLIGAATSLAGHTLGIGLFAVTLARACVGDMPKLLWPTAGLLGGVAAVWVDALTRAAGDVQELPLGVVCAALAAVGLVLSRPNVTAPGDPP